MSVGQGVEYEALLAEARKFVDVWVPWGVENSQGSWGAGFVHVQPEGDGHDLSVLTYGWESRGLGHHTHVSHEYLLGSAISLLIYCCAHPGEASA